MKKIIINLIAILAIIAGLTIAAIGHGLLACLSAIMITYIGAITLIDKNTNWIWIR